MAVAIKLRTGIQVAVGRDEALQQRIRKEDAVTLLALPGVAQRYGIVFASADEADPFDECGSVRCIANAQHVQIGLTPTGDVHRRARRNTECEHERLDVLGERLVDRRPACRAVRDGTVGLEDAPNEGAVDRGIIGGEYRVGNSRYRALAAMILGRRELGEAARFPPEGQGDRVSRELDVAALRTSRSARCRRACGSTHSDDRGRPYRPSPRRTEGPSRAESRRP